jgi:hypothetical protein
MYFLILPFYKICSKVQRTVDLGLLFMVVLENVRSFYKICSKDCGLRPAAYGCAVERAIHKD